MAQDKVYPEGIFFNEKREQAPDFVIGSLGIPDKNVFINWLKSQSGDKINLDILYGRNGKPYTVLNEYQANKVNRTPAPAPMSDKDTIEGFPEDDIPF